MDERSSDTEARGADKRSDGAAVEDATLGYVGRWNRLVSTTNWEKGRIIGEWRTALAAAGAPAAEYSDEAWSRRVGGVSPQHVGRLRRAYDRFGDDYPTYEGLHWSHFQSGLDWDDAEMWLEGAAQNGWSVSQMRTRRWETLGSPAGEKPRDADIVTSEFDEDVHPQHEAGTDPATIAASRDTVRDPRREESFGPDFGEESSAASSRSDASSSSTDGTASGLLEKGGDADATPLRPFASLAELPDDLSAAFEAFKLAILRHKTSGWQDVAANDVVATLDALKELALAKDTGR